MPLAVGLRLGPYQVQEALGAGDMGEVYKGLDTRLGRIVTIKVLPRELGDNPESRQRLEREARTLSRFSHSHICTLYDIGQEGDLVFLVMEYLQGETLAFVAHRGKVSGEGQAATHAGDE
jgi:serine/threonine protein kinase